MKLRNYLYDGLKSKHTLLRFFKDSGAPSRHSSRVLGPVRARRSACLRQNGVPSLKLERRQGLCRQAFKHVGVAFCVGG